MPNKISFVIATVDRDEQLQKCIFSIEKAHENNASIPVEILVVIQKAKQPKELRLRFPEITNIYYLDKLGLSVARNFAIDKSTGDYLVFLDDDASVDGDFIDVLLKNILMYSKVSAFCGKLWDPNKQAPFISIFCDNKSKLLRRLDYQYFMGSAHILSRKVIKKIGGYNERFGVGSKYYCGGEESEYFIRLKVAKEQVLYLPDLIFFHPIILPTYKYAYNYGHAFGAMMVKNCVNDKFYFYVYIFIILKTVSKLSVRLLQKLFLREKYKDLNERYHYDAWLRGILKGIKDFIIDEL